MFRKQMLSALVLICCFCFLFTASVAAKTTQWKIQAPVGAADPLFKALERWAENVNAMTDGRLQITMYSGQSIVPVTDMLDATSDNIIQGNFVPPQFWAGKNPAFAFCSDINGGYPEVWQFITWFNKKGGREFLQKLFDPYGVYCLGGAVWGMEVIPSKRPISKVDDFKGVKIRVAPGIVTMLMEKLGASAVVLPPTEIYSALDKGVLDATDYSGPSVNMSYGFHKIAKYFNYPGIHSMPLGVITVNKKEYEKLPDDIKGILESSIHSWHSDVHQTMAVDDINAVKKMTAEGAVVTVWTEAERKKLREIAVQVWTEFAKKGPDCEPILQSHLKWMKELGLLD